MNDKPPTSLASNEVIHFYAGWPGKVMCAAGGNPISSIKADDVTCETCKTMLTPARLIDPCVVDGDELAKIEDGWGDPAGTYLKYRGQVWINDGWLDISKVRALRDWLSGVLNGDSPSPSETTAPLTPTGAERLAEAEKLILRMAGEGYNRARFYVDKYDLTGEQRSEKASAQSKITDVRPLDLEKARRDVADVIAEELESEKWPNK